MYAPKGFTILYLKINYKNKYKKIVEERKKLSMQGYALGFGLAVVLIVLNITMKKQKLSKRFYGYTTAATMFRSISLNKSTNGFFGYYYIYFFKVKTNG